MVLVMVIMLLVVVIMVFVMILLFMQDGPIRNFVRLCVETGKAIAEIKTTNISFEGCAEPLSLITGLLLSG